VKLDIIILAAGQGTRMNSSTPKVLHEIGGRPMLEHVIATAEKLNPNKIYIVHSDEKVLFTEKFSQPNLEWCLQSEQKGTGHAVAQALPELNNQDRVLVLYGDVPFLKPDTLISLLSILTNEGLSVLTADVENPTGYGRIIRDKEDQIISIREERDASDAERRITECNTGVLAAHTENLKEWTKQISSDNSQSEYYLTDCIEIAIKSGKKVDTLKIQTQDEILGVNDKIQLAQAEATFQKEQREKLMLSGVTLLDPDRVFIRGEITTSGEVTIDTNVILEGKVLIGKDVYIGPNTIIKDSTIGAGSQIFANTIIETSKIGERCKIGPFSRIRPETELSEEAHIGNFVELKKSTIGSESKINHLSYVGDTAIGKRVNIGAGTITCNYDGAQKHKTLIGDDVFIGSDTQLIAPVQVNSGATIGAGSTITKDAPTDKLTLSRAEQKTVDDWTRPKKK
jgi:bifunctional UDP-N-acetylglucosamine pyrophosphorylase/glucosamine-1-phosphate N-acetyltransferase